MGWDKRRELFKSRYILLKGAERLTDRIAEHATPISRLYLANTAQIYPEDRG